jgi:hypothetical protein
MSEPVLFWLDNKNCAGIKAAAIGDQVLVLYRNRYYIVTDGGAQSRGGKPVKYSTTSLPSDWGQLTKRKKSYVKPRLPSEAVGTCLDRPVCSETKCSRLSG